MWEIVSTIFISCIIALFFYLLRQHRSLQPHNNNNNNNDGDDSISDDATTSLTAEPEQQHHQQNVKQKEQLSGSGVNNQKKKDKKKVKKSSSTTVVDPQQKKWAREEKKRKKEEEELQLLREETRKWREEQEIIKQKQQQLTQIKDIIKAKMTEKEREEDRQKILQKRDLFLQEERRLEAERKKQFASKVKPNSPSPAPSAWAVPSTAIMTATPSLKDIQSETYANEKKREASMSEVDLQREKYRKERQERKREINQTRERNNAYVHVFEERVNKYKLEIQKKFQEQETSDKKLQSLFLAEKKKLLWKDPTQFKIDENDVGRISGIPAEAHPLLIGEKGSNINLLRLLNVHVNVSFSAGDPIAIRGNKTDVLAAYEKIKQLLQWKHFKDIAKNHSELRSKYHSDASMYQQQKNLDKSKECTQLSTVHEHVMLWAQQESTTHCIKFHNDNLVKNRIDLRGLKDDEASSYFLKRITEVEQLSSNLFLNEAEVFVNTGEQFSVSVVMKELVEYLKEYRFNYQVELSKGLIVVQL